MRSVFHHIADIYKYVLVDMKYRSDSVSNMFDDTVTDHLPSTSRFYGEIAAAVVTATETEEERTVDD